MVEATATNTVPTIKKMYVTYDAVHESIARSVPALAEAGFHHPDYLVAVSGGGLIPARMLRTMLREDAGANGKSKGSVATIRVIGLELYNDDAEGQQYETGVLRTQWLTEQTFSDLAGKTVLIVDEVDDTRLTLSFAVREMLLDIQVQEARIFKETGTAPVTRVGVFVVHNKQRPKKAELPQGIPEFVAWHLDGNPWVVYPWDAVNIEEHNRLAKTST